LLLDRYGKKLPNEHSGARLNYAGDVDGAAIWVQVSRAIEDLIRAAGAIMSL
jgi:hypothetical protein